MLRLRKETCKGKQRPEMLEMLAKDNGDKVVVRRDIDEEV